MKRLVPFLILTALVSFSAYADDSSSGNEASSTYLYSPQLTSPYKGRIELSVLGLLVAGQLDVKGQYFMSEKASLDLYFLTLLSDGPLQAKYEGQFGVREGALEAYGFSQSMFGIGTTIAFGRSIKESTFFSTISLQALSESITRPDSKVIEVSESHFNLGMGYQWVQSSGLSYKLGVTYRNPLSSTITFDGKDMNLDEAVASVNMIRLNFDMGYSF